MVTGTIENSNNRNITGVVERKDKKNKLKKKVKDKVDDNICKSN